MFHHLAILHTRILSQHQALTSWRAYDNWTLSQTSAEFCTRSSMAWCICSNDGAVSMAHNAQRTWYKYMMQQTDRIASQQRYDKISTPAWTQWTYITYTSTLAFSVKQLTSRHCTAIYITKVASIKLNELQDEHKMI